MGSAHRGTSRSLIVAVAALIMFCAACSRRITPSEVEGLWRQASGNAVAAFAATRLEFRSDGTFGFERMPREFFGSFVTLPPRVDAEGSWALSQDGGNSRIELSAHVVDGESTLFGKSVYVSGSVGAVSISFFLGDPDLGQGVRFEKVQFVQSEPCDRGVMGAIAFEPPE